MSRLLLPCPPLSIVPPHPPSLQEAGLPVALMLLLQTASEAAVPVAAAAKPGDASQANPTSDSGSQADWLPELASQLASQVRACVILHHN